MKLPFGLSSERPRVIQRRDGIGTHGESRRPALWIVARSLCHYFSTDLSAVPRADREAAVDLKIDQWSPIPEFDRYVAWDGGRAMIWIWPRREVADAQLDLDVEVHAVLPETAMQELDRSPGARLVACCDGFEAQVWSDEGHLVHSRWWPRLPDEGAWQRFLRGAGSTPTPLAAIGDAPAWRAGPWALRRQRMLGSRQLERRVMLAALLLLGVALAAVLGEVAAKYRQLAVIEGRIAAVEDESSEILAARADAFRFRDDAARFAARVPTVGQAEMMAAFAQALAASFRDGDRFTRWTFQDQQVRLDFVASNGDPTAIVRALEALDFVASVQVARGRGRGEYQLRMDLVAS